MIPIDQTRLVRLIGLLRPTVTDGDTASRSVVAFFAGMPEVERRELAPTILRLHKTAWLGLRAAAISSEHRDTQDTQNLDTWHTSIALVATASLAELQKLKTWHMSVAACQAMAERRPTWLAEGIEFAFERTEDGWSTGKLAYFVHGLVMAGAIAPPAHERYAIGMAYGYGIHQASESRLVDRVRKDIDRIEPVIWRQFEVEGGGEISLANFDKYCASKVWVQGSWAETLKTLTDENRLDRQRLLDASLDALNRGFSQYRAGWFSRFHEMLEPTLDERAARADRYLDLLASPIGPTVSLAMTALKRLHKAGRLDAHLVAERIRPALHVSAAVTAKGALGLLKAAGSEEDLRPVIVPIAAAALEHPKIDVQEAALALIEGYASELDEASRRAIADRLDVMSATLRGRAEALLGVASAEGTPDVGADMAELKAKAELLPSDLRRLAGVDAAFANGGNDIARAKFTGMEIPRLDPNKAIAPIATFEELVDEALVAIEHPHDLDRVERVLAGALRFSADRPADAEKIFGPLARSLQRYRSSSEDGRDWSTPRGALQIVLSAFTTARPGGCAVAESDPHAVIVLRTTAMQQAIGGRVPRIQLSAPTHRGHWVDPEVLVERSRAATAPGTAPLLGVADQILALLRLAPDRRKQALEAACALPGEWGAALRYALGGDAPPGGIRSPSIAAALRQALGGGPVGRTRSLWIAAARARAPFDDDPQVAALVQGPLRGADQAPCFAFDATPRPVGWFTVARAIVEVLGADVERPSTLVDPEKCFTTVALCDRAQIKSLDAYQPSGTFHAGGWAAALWPQHPEPLFALSAKAKCMLDGSALPSANEPIVEGLKLILEPDVPIGPMALLMLCRGLNAIDKAASQATVDALIALIDDGRLDGETLGGALHEFLMNGVVIPKRWPDRVKDVARSSRLALLVMRRALERSLHPGSATRELRDMHAWLDLLRELCIEAGEAIEDPLTRQSLEACPDGRKAKAAARALLALKSARAGAIRQSAAAHALRQRILRAERWNRLAP
jgi:hypothetical protein